MKIKTLAMENFRIHQNTRLNLGWLNFILGRNNSGKSSIQAAIEWNLLGKCQWTDRGGRGAADLVLAGAKQASVALEMEGIGSIVRTLPPHSLQVGSISGVIEGQADILNRLATDEDSLRIALNSGSFLNLTPAEQRAFLFAAYGLNFTAEGVTEQLTTWFQEKGYPEETARTLAGQAKGWYPAQMTGGPEVLDVMEKRAKDLRREQKRDKQRTEAAIEELELALQGLRQVPGVDQVAEIRANLEVVRKRRDELLKHSGSQDEQARREKLLIRRQALEEKIAGVKAKGTELAAKLKELGDPVEEDLVDEIKMLQARLEHLKALSTTVGSRLKTLSEASQALAAADRRCPLAPSVIQCSLTAKQLEKILTNINLELQATQREYSDISEGLQETALELAEREKQQQENQDIARQVALLQGEMKTQKLLYDQYTSDKNAVEQELAVLPEPSGEVNHYADQIARADQMIQDAEVKLEQAKEAAQLTRRLVDLKADLQTLTTEVSHLEVLVKALGPEGLRKKLLVGILGNFLGRVNDRLGRLTEGAYQISLNGDMALLCRANGGPLLPIKLLSKSEQLRVGIAIQEALSHAAGLSFLAIDEADMLDQENRDLLTGWLLDLAGEYEQVLVFTTVGDVPPQNPGIEGVKMFWVEDGRVSEVG